jgi:hypothetical protein
MDMNPLRRLDVSPLWVRSSIAALLLVTVVWERGTAKAAEATDCETDLRERELTRIRRLSMRVVLLGTVLALILSACTGEAPPSTRYMEGSACTHPGGRCVSSDECCSQMCDADYCRGPMPRAGS